MTKEDYARIKRWLLGLAAVPIAVTGHRGKKCWCQMMLRRCWDIAS